MRIYKNFNIIKINFISFYNICTFVKSTLQLKQLVNKYF